MHLILVITGTRDHLSIEEQLIVRGKMGSSLSSLLRGDGATWQVFVGDCPTGIDAWVADMLHRTKSPRPLVFHADWRAHEKSAGPIRNREMIDAAVDLAANGALVKVLAFPKGKSPGTRNCIGLACKAGLDVSVTELEEKP